MSIHIQFLKSSWLEWNISSSSGRAVAPQSDHIEVEKQLVSPTSKAASSNSAFGSELELSGDEEVIISEAAIPPQEETAQEDISWIEKSLPEPLFWRLRKGMS